jgi:Ca-activated chloride channel family protein
MLHSRVVPLLLPCLVVVGFLSAQNRNDTGDPAGLRVDIRLVNVTATVTDLNGRYANGLTKDDFVVEEDGVPQKIAHFSQDHDVPVSVGIVLDTSGSMERKIRTAIRAVEDFIQTIHEDDDIFLMTFASKAILRQDFTNNREKLRKALEHIPVTGGTALYDALEEGLNKVKSGHHDKRAILLITDGEDTHSTVTFNEALRTVSQSQLLVYALGISPQTYGEKTEHVPFNWPPSVGGPRVLRNPAPTRRDTVDMNVLRNFASYSGGRAFLLSDSVLGAGNEIQRVLSMVADELRGQYTLGYYPTHSDDDRFHTLKIRTRPGLLVRARQGYLAASSP